MELLKKLVGKNQKKLSSSLSLAEAMSIAGDYGGVLEKNAGTMVVDASKLPYSKEKIKEALIVVLRGINDLHKLAVIKAGYLRLADFQDGVGKDVLPFSMFAEGSDMPLEKFVEKFLEQDTRFEKWSSIIDAERALLESELKKLEFWKEYDVSAMAYGKSAILTWCITGWIYAGVTCNVWWLLGILILLVIFPGIFVATILMAIFFIPFWFLRNRVMSDYETKMKKASILQFFVTILKFGCYIGPVLGAIWYVRFLRRFIESVP